MIKEAIDRVVDLSEVKVIEDIPQGNAGEYHVMEGGSHKFVHAKPCNRDHEIHGIASLKAAVELYCLDSGVCWIDGNQVVVVIDDSDRFDQMFMPLEKNPIVEAIECINKSFRTPKQLTEFLRHDCATVHVSPGGFDDLISALKFHTETDEEHNHGRTKDSMGTSVRSEVTGASELPKQVEIEFDYYPAIEVDTTVVVRFSLITEPSRGVLQLRAYPGDLDSAQQQSVEAICTELREVVLKDLPVTVLCGTP